MDFNKQLGYHWCRFCIEEGYNRRCRIQHTGNILKVSICLNRKLWDIAGQERFASMTRIYYKEAFAALIVCDATRPELFKNIERV